MPTLKRDTQKPLFGMMVFLFFCWGLATVLMDSLVPKLKMIFSLGYTEVLLTQFSFFIGYFIFSLPASYVLSRFGYVKSIVIALMITVAGCVLFIPAAVLQQFMLFLLALFILAAGITLLQVSVNPLILALELPIRSNSRLTLAQAFNSLGTTLGPLIGAAVILEKVTAQNMTPILWPFLLIAIGFALIALILWSHRDDWIFPPLMNPVTLVNWGLLKQARFRLGWLSIFCYVGAEVTIGSLLSSYLMQPHVLLLPLQIAGSLVSLYWGGAMIGRFLGAWVLSKIGARLVLGTCSLMAFFLVLLSTLSQGFLAAGAIISVGFFNSVMFPVIFSMTLDGLGEATPSGSGLLCMAIVGGALVPLLTGFIADHIGLTHALWLPAVGYLIITRYAMIYSRFSKP